VDVNGIITTVAGDGTFSAGGDGGPAISAQLNHPLSVTLDAAGDLYIADTSNNRIRKVDTNGIIITVAGNGTAGFSGDGGLATNAGLNLPQGVAVDAAGNLYFADTWDMRVRKVDTNGIITTVAGNGSHGFSGNGGPATSAELFRPSGVAVDAAGNLYIADADNDRIRKVDVNGTISTVAGNGVYGFSGDGGPATQAELYQSSPFPWGVILFSVADDGPGNLYIADSGNSVIRKVDVSQSAAIFGQQNAGTTSSSQKVVVTNTGNQHIDLSGLNLSGDFGQLTGIASDCTDTTMLGAGHSCALRITFSPATAGALTGSATVTDNSLTVPGTTQTISLSGTGVTP
jgi:hypothetical protein